jgi:hypothetical protein
VCTPRFLYFIPATSHTYTKADDRAKSETSTETAGKARRNREPSNLLWELNSFLLGFSSFFSFIRAFPEVQLSLFLIFLLLRFFLCALNGLIRQAHSRLHRQQQFFFVLFLSFCPLRVGFV